MTSPQPPSAPPTNPQPPKKQRTLGEQLQDLETWKALGLLVGVVAIIFVVIYIARFIAAGIVSFLFDAVFGIGGLPAVVILLVLCVAGYIAWDWWSKQKKKGA